MDKNDMKSIALLVTLYSFQGALLTLFTSTIPLILSEQGRTISELSVMSIASYPFSLKIILAPFVDTFHFARFGKRKTYIVITGYLLTILLLFSLYPIHETVSTTTQSSLETPTTSAISPTQAPLKPIALIAFTSILLIAIQDIAVDAWALKIISQPHLSFAPLTQSLGMTLGFLAAGSMFFILKLELSAFLLTFSLIVLTVTAFIHFFVSENGFNNQILASITGSELESNEDPLNKETKIEKGSQISRLLSTMRGFYSNQHLRMLIFLLCVQNIGVGPILASFNLRIQKAGISKERISNCQVYLLPVQSLVPYVIAKYLQNTLKLGHRMLVLQLFVQFAQYAFYQALTAGIFEGQDVLETMLIVGIQCVDSLVISGLIQVRSTFFAKVASAGFEGMYLTMLTSVQNISRRSTISTFQYVDDYLNFNYSAPILWIVQIIFICYSWSKYVYMDSLHQHDWCLLAKTDAQSKGQATQQQPLKKLKGNNDNELQNQKNNNKNKNNSKQKRE